MAPSVHGTSIYIAYDVPMLEVVREECTKEYAIVTCVAVMYHYAQQETWRVNHIKHCNIETIIIENGARKENCHVLEHYDIVFN